MTQLNLFNLSNDTQVTKILNGKYVFIPAFFNVQEVNRYFELREKNILWKQEESFYCGRKVKFIRFTVLYGDNDKAYSISRITLNPNPWTNELQEIKKHVEKISDTIFNIVLRHTEIVKAQ